MNDLRRPTGYLFSLLGAILCIYGMVKPAVRAPLDMETNVNLWCGLIILIFGGILLWLSLRAKS
jgi:hypothetical protein